MYKLQIVILQAFKDKHFRAWDLGRWDLVWELPFPSTIVCSTSTCCQPIFLYFAGNEQQFTKRCLLKSYNSRWWNCLQYQGLNAGHPFSCLFFSECSWNCTHKVHTYLCHILPVHSGGMMSWMGPVLQLLQPKVNQDWLHCIFGPSGHKRQTDIEMLWGRCASLQGPFPVPLLFRVDRGVDAIAALPGDHGSSLLPLGTPIVSERSSSSS